MAPFRVRHNAEQIFIGERKQKVSDLMIAFAPQKKQYRLIWAEAMCNGILPLEVFHPDLDVEFQLYIKCPIGNGVYKYSPVEEFWPDEIPPYNS